MVLWLAFQNLKSQSVIEVDDAVDHHDFMAHDLYYAVDTANQVSFKEISSANYKNNFRQHAAYINSDFRKNASYWVRLTIQKNTVTKKYWLLEFYDQTIDSLTAYYPQGDGSYKEIILGDHQDFSSRLFIHKNFELPLEFHGEGLETYYFKIRSHEFADIRLALRSTNYFVYYALNEYYLYGMFYGMILIIVVYNLLVFLAIREIKFIYYICYLISVALYAMSYDGIGFQYLWPSYPVLNDWAVGVSLYLVIVWSLIFTRRFLSTKANAPQLDRALKIMIVARTIWFVFSLLVSRQMLTFRTLEIIPLSLIFFTAIKVWRSGYRPARFFVIAYGLLFFGFFLRTLVYVNILPFTTLTHYSLHFSFVFEMLFLTVALGDRIRILKDNRDRAMKRIIHQHEVNMRLKDKVNLELEKKVAERTQELHHKNEELIESNAKLNRQSVEINQINSILDLDNWKLKNKVKEVLEERMHEKQMDYDEFKTLYPDDLSCYRFLEKLKEQKGFECVKCRNVKHSPGPLKFSRRCTRCGYNESITSNTLFHGVKFPIGKAFYLTYLVQSGKNTFTLEALAEKLQLRLSTVWAFKHKVEERMISIEQTHAGGNPWEEIVLDREKPKTTAKKKTVRSNPKN